MGFRLNREGPWTTSVEDFSNGLIVVPARLNRLAARSTRASPAARRMNPKYRYGDGMIRLMGAKRCRQAMRISAIRKYAGGSIRLLVSTVSAIHPPRRRASDRPRQKDERAHRQSQRSLASRSSQLPGQGLD